MTDSTACPPEAQAFSTDSIGLAAMPGTVATRPESSPCLFNVKLHAEPTAPTSILAGGTLICSQTPVTALDTICGTVMSISFPNFDWL